MHIKIYICNSLLFNLCDEILLIKILHKKNGMIFEDLLKFVLSKILYLKKNRKIHIIKDRKTYWLLRN
jgi:hypothetical protein